MRTKAYLILVGLIFTSAVFGGCFMWNYVKQGYQNFSAYFNTYYNGRQAFEDGMADVSKSKMEYNINMISGAQPYTFTISPTARQKFDVAIEKSSKVLQFYPTSEFTEDCLFIIGISYYYEGDNLRSQRKFVEAQSTFPKSKRYAEAQMYYGSLEIRDLNNDAGYKDVREAMKMARKDKNDKVVAGSAEILSDYYLSRGDTATAAAYLDSAATSSSADESAIYACRSGDLFMKTGQYSVAVKEYERAWSQARDIRLRFYSKYYLARAQRLERKFYGALQGLAELRSDDKFFQYFPLIEYQRAEVLYDSGEVSSAVASFQKIDTTYATNEAATRSAFRLANIYLYKVADYQTALKFFQKCSAHPVVYNVTNDAKQMSVTLQDYFINSYKVVLTDSLYDRALNAAEKKDSLAEQSQANLDSLYEHAAEAHQLLGGFYLFKLQIPDSAIGYYKAIVRDFPKSKVYPSALYTLGEYYYSSSDTVEGRKYLRELVQEHPESDYAASASQLLGIPPPPEVVDSSQTRYDKAMKFLNADKPDSAVSVLENLLSNHKSAIVPQALYALGWVYEKKLHQPDSAFVYYKRLVAEFPSSDFSSNVTLALSGYEQVQRDSAAARMREEKARQDSASKSTVPGTEKHIQQGVQPRTQIADTLKTVHHLPVDSPATFHRLPVDSPETVHHLSVDSTKSVHHLLVDSLETRREQLKELIKRKE